MANCLFCSIIAGQIPAEIIARTQSSLAFKDIDPKAPVHFLVVPLEHSENLTQMSAQAAGQLISDATQAAKDLGLDPAEQGFRLVLNSGAGAGQTVFHTHVHVLGGRDFLWPPG